MSASSVASAMWLRASSRCPVDASIHAASSRAPARSRAGPASPAASSADRIRCAPLLSPRTTQAQPNPLTMLSASSGSCAMLHANAASMLARSARAKERCSAWCLLRTPWWTDRAASSEPSGVRREGGLRPAGHRSSERRAANARYAVQQSVATKPTSAHPRRSPATCSQAGRPRRSPRPPARRALR